MLCPTDFFSLTAESSPSLHYDETAYFFRDVPPLVSAAIVRLLSTTSFTALLLSGTPTSENTVYREEIGAAHRKLDKQ
jgi:hypothetical protein